MVELGSQGGGIIERPEHVNTGELLGGGKARQRPGVSAARDDQAVETHIVPTGQVKTVAIEVDGRNCLTEPPIRLKILAYLQVQILGFDRADQKLLRQRGPVVRLAVLGADHCQRSIVTSPAQSLGGSHARERCTDDDDVAWSQRPVTKTTVGRSRDTAAG